MNKNWHYLFPKNKKIVAYEGMNVYALPADGDYYRKRMCHHALATKTNRLMILIALWKKMLPKSARKFDSDPWFSNC